MSLIALALGFICVLIFGYFSYGRFVSNRFRLNNNQKTPAHELRDDLDFVPTKKFYLFGQHFSAIAAAGPIAGPIAACQTFGWVPCLIWIGVGVIFIGAVHDFSSLIASLRHKGCSIAELSQRLLGKQAGLSIMIFVWIALVYIIVAFTDITASAFVSGSEELEGTDVLFNRGGAVAMASLLYLLLAGILGIVQKLWAPPLGLLTLIFVPLAFGMTWLGTTLSTVLLFDATTWGILILLYCGIASVLPVWSLLQPRGYLGGFILYFALAVGLAGIFLGDFPIEQPAFLGFDVGGSTGQLFPFLFVTIACGACSGFHGLVCSGTTSKQIDQETDVKPVGFGAMLAEGLVAFIALAIIMIASKEDIQGLKPGTIYGQGIGRFLTLLVGEEHLQIAVTFGAMAFSTFVFDTLDVSARLGRTILQELTGWKDRKGALVGTLLTIGAPALILLTAGEGSWLKFWTLFGASNQLLAALTLFLVFYWFKSMGRPAWFLGIPALFVFSMTTWALFSIGITTPAILNRLAAFTLIALSLFVIGIGLKRLRLNNQS